MEKQPRFFDEGDFTSAHEKIHLWAIEQFPKFNAYYSCTYIIKQRINDLRRQVVSYRKTLKLKEELEKLKDEKTPDYYKRNQHDQIVKSFFVELPSSDFGNLGFKDSKDDIGIYLTPDNEEELIMKREHQLVGEIDTIEDLIIKYEGTLKKYQEDGCLIEHVSPSYKKCCVMPKYKLEPVLKGYPPVYPDCILFIEEERTGDIINVVIEIKSFIDNFEPVMRQMQIYRSRFESSSAFFMLIYPEKYSKYDAVFKSQGIEIVHCPDSLLE